MNLFNGKLVAGINSKVQLFKWTETEESVKQLVAGKFLVVLIYFLDFYKNVDIVDIF